jgi:transposase-like protein
VDSGRANETRSAPRMKPRRYSDDDRAKALAALAANGGELRKTAAELGIPEATLRSWANGTYHPEATQAAARQKSDLAARWERVANAALDVLDRSSGELRPRDAATVGGIATDKMLLLRGDAPVSATVVIKVVSGDWVSDL